MGNQNDKKKSQKKRPKKNVRRTVMSFSEAEEKNLLEKWKEDKYLVKKDKIIDYPNKNESLNIYLYQCLYISIKKDPDKINVYCPYCLKSQNYKSVIEPESNEYTFHFNREYYEEKLLNDLNDDNTIQNELDILNRYSKDCKHFFHTECIEKKNKIGSHYCYYCKNHINAENIILFGGFKNYEELGTYVAKFNYVNYKPKQIYNFEKRALEIIRNFIKREEGKVRETKNGWKWKTAIEFGDKFRSLGNKYDYYKYSYDFCIDIYNTHNFDEKKFIEEEKNAIAYYEEEMRKKKEREKRRREKLRQRREAEEEEEEYSYTSSKSKKRYGRAAHTCPDCNRKCYKCGKIDYPLYWKFTRAHIDCLNSIKRGCVICKQKKFDILHDVGFCGSCNYSVKINRKICILCNEEIDD